jgi:hypothetical protein
MAQNDLNVIVMDFAHEVCVRISLLLLKRRVICNILYQHGLQTCPDNSSLNFLSQLAERQENSEHATLLMIEISPVIHVLARKRMTYDSPIMKSFLLFQLICVRQDLDRPYQILRHLNRMISCYRKWSIVFTHQEGTIA